MKQCKSKGKKRLVQVITSGGGHRGKEGRREVREGREEKGEREGERWGGRGKGRIEQASFKTKGAFLMSLHRN